MGLFGIESWHLVACFLLLSLRQRGQAQPVAPSNATAALNTTLAAQEGGTKPELSVETGQTPSKEPVSGVSKAQAQALKPAYHITASTGWMNDPNGMFQTRAGIYHVFYQWNPVAPVWGPPYWGHVISTDLVHWTRLPPALMPDTEYDSDGVFSGSATVLDDGTPVLFYTGVSGFAQLGYYKQVQAAARPANITSDPHLTFWIKSAANPLIADPPPQGTFAQFRDPTTAWQQVDSNSYRCLQDGLWFTAVGSMESCQGAAGLYSSSDFATWQRAGTWASQGALGQLGKHQCIPPAVAQPGIGSCDQFGSYCRMWECPDVFEISNGTWVMKWSDQSKTRDPYAMDWYTIGGQAQGKVRSDSADQSSTLFQASVQPLQQSVDYGSIYASKSFPLLDGRRVLLGWAYETAAGCVEQCSLGTNFTSSLGWQGAHTLPRKITYDAASASLLMNPVHEVAALRTGVLFNASSLSLPPENTTSGLLALNMLQSASHGRQLEVQATLRLASPGASAANASSSRAFVVGLQLDTAGSAYTRVFMNGSAATAENGSIVIIQAAVFVDRTHSGRYSNTTAQGGPIPLPPGGLQTSSLTLRLFVDRSLLEVYALGGRGRVTSRVYPMGVSDDWKYSVFSSSNAVTCTADILIYEMGQAFGPDDAAACC